MTFRRITGFLALSMILTAGSPAANAQMSDSEREMGRWLDDDGDFLSKDGRDLAVVRDVVDRTMDLEPGSRIEINASRFGNIRIRGWNQDRIQVTAKVKAATQTREEAEALGEKVEVVIEKKTEKVDIYSDGPGMRNETFWSVNFEVSVPARSDLRLDTRFGEIAIDDVDGDLSFYAEFGSIDLERVSGRVVGETKFGSVRVYLDGNQWNGDRLDVSTQFGGIKAYIPKDYSADLDTGTSFGSLSLDFPVTVKGSMMGKQVRTKIGDGGVPIRLRTQFGGVDIRER